LIFEERLKLNMVRLKKRQQKYEGTHATRSHLLHMPTFFLPRLFFFRC
jgi:hypothetical protein